jgi:hypothetical protein
MPRRGERFALLLWTCGSAIAIAILAANLPPHGFYSGDQGVKLIAARNAIAHPERPFQADLPTIGGEAVPFVDRFFSLHDGHAHALQSPLFPVLSAPFIAVFGLRGAYVIPAVSFVALLPLIYLISRRTDADIPLRVLAAITLFANPVFFYALEYWELVPAVACLAACTALALKPPPTTASRVLSAAVWAGILAAMAVLLRPEAIWYAAAIGLFLAWRGSIRSYIVGFAVVMGPFLLANYVESGSVLGHHAAANLAPIGDRWLSARMDRAALWLGSSSPLFLSGIAMAASAWCARLLGAGLRTTQLAFLVGAVVAALPAVIGGLDRASLLHAWALGLLPMMPRESYRDIGPLLFIAAVTTIGVLLSSTHDGGAQWGPRFLLIATPALSVLAASAATEATRPGQFHRLRWLLVLLLVGSGMWATRSGYRELRGAKQYYARLVDGVASKTQPGGYVITNIWWFDQICASLYPTRTILFAETSEDASRAVRSLEQAGTGSVLLAWSREETAPLNETVTGTCYSIEEVANLNERQVTLATATCGSRPGEVTK